MALKKKGTYWYGSTLDDLKGEIVRFSKLNGYEAAKFSASTCKCLNLSFRLETDEEEGASRRVCTACGAIHLMGDSADYANNAKFVRHECVCEAETFRLLSGVALYEGTNDIRWYYIGCHCTVCQLVGVFAHWKSEAGNAETFLAET
ncbi:MAG: hypothetical protein Q8J65_10460, partial [Nitrosomonadales bacterium]|nr:hypothetical protein [Nitrosomonadales bacterium]